VRRIAADRLPNAPPSVCEIFARTAPCSTVIPAALAFAQRQQRVVEVAGQIVGGEAGVGHGPYCEIPLTVPKPEPPEI